MKRLAPLLLSLIWGSALAHPVDEVVQGAYLTLLPGKVQLELDITPGEKVAGTVLRSLDTNADGHVTEVEARAYAKRVLDQSTLKVGAQQVRWTLQKVDVPPVDLLKVGGGILKIYASASRTDQVGAQTLSYQNRYQPAKSQWTANVFLQPAAGWQYRVTGQARSNDGRTLTAKYQVARS
ncbi:hypothetical protein [Deinococcus hopiensis]|uniref:EF-hand domain-containing protein n=1 Tax=Deinococcus hopiensis KR-140 TaxID=695939 RepID=A0A1W1UC78_9DEIO|nr:hypothetical protein [Deinococcus hopiensis]SMB78411.1 hypothetical protein SAMN00790413_06647 [Deinococcus hopiensis KR-140]